jgi:hypothetical protein
MVTSFFGDFPRISYSLDDNETQQVVTDIFRRIILSNEFKENSAFFEEYEVGHGETPEQISHRFYGTSNLHWLVLLVNDIIDPRFDWPMSEENLKVVTEEKYGGKDTVFTVQNALNNTGKRVETFFLLAENSTYENPIRIVYESRDANYTKQPVQWLDDTPKIDRYETNYDVETNKNEENRSIKILKPDIVSEVITKYKELINAE